MSGSVWYLFFSKKKIGFEKYSEKKKIKKKEKKLGNKSSKSKKALMIFIFAFSLMFFISFVSAAAINDTLHLNLQTTDGSGDITTGTFAFGFNITNNSDSTCLSSIVYNHSVSQATDDRGIVSIYLPTSGSEDGNLSALDYNVQYYLCYYRDGTLKSVSQLGRVPYAFRATQVNLSEVTVDSNLNLADNYNITDVDTGFFSFLGTLLERIGNIFATDVNISNNLTVGGNITFDGLIFGNGSQLTDISSATLDGYDSSYFMPLNTSVVGDFDITGSLDVDGDWASGGVTIDGGDIYAQTIYVYNITSLDVTQQNLTINDDFLVFGNSELMKNLSVDTNTLFVDSSTDRVGIGTVTPRVHLEVAGEAFLTGQASDPTSGTGLRLGYDSDDVLSFIVSKDFSASIFKPIWFKAVDYRFNFAGGEKIRFDTSGNVGIGTTTPTALLNINTSNTTAAFHVQGRNATGTTVTQFYIENSSGNVGINTTTPQNTLNVIGDANISGQILTGDITNSAVFAHALATTSGIGIDAGGSPGVSLIGNNKVLLKAEDGGNNIYFAPGGTEAVRIITGGNVGINTTTPQNKLNVVGDLNVTGTIYGAGDANLTDTYVPYTGAFKNVDLGANNLSVDTSVLFVDSNNDRVGIGNSSPAVDLDVTGDVRFRNEQNVGAYFQFDDVHSDGRQRLIHVEGANTAQILAARASSGGTSGNLAFGHTNGNTFSVGGVSGQIVITDGSLGLVGHSIGGNFQMGTHKSLAIGTPNSAWTTGFGTTDIVDLATYSDEGNTWGGVRPSIRYTALTHEFRVDNSTGVNNPGTSALYIDESGNVGINTTTPQNTLNVVGDLNVTGTIYGPGGANITGDYVPYTGATQNVDLGANNFTVDSSVLHVDSNNDRVGIGLTTPLYPLDVNGVSFFRNMIYVQDGKTIGSYSGNGARIYFNNTWGTQFANQIGKFVIFSNDNPGRVGIGTMSPSVPLEIVSSSGDAVQIRTDSAATGTTAEIGFRMTTSEASTNYAGIRANRTDSPSSTDTDLTFFTRGSGASADRLTISTGGNTGINTTNPGALLHVGGGDILLDNNQAINMKDSGGTIQDILTFTSSDNVQLFGKSGTSDIYVGAASYLTVKAAGNVGVGTATPQNTLNVVGDLNVTGTIYGPGGANITGDYVPYTGADKNVDLGANNFSVDTSVLFVDSNNDRVGIGTTSPNSLLELEKTGGVSLRIKSLTSGNPTINFYEDTTEKANVFWSRAGNRFVINNIGTVTTINENGGNVGIGTSSPGAKLDVNGSVRILGGNVLTLQNLGADNGFNLNNTGTGGLSVLDLGGAMVIEETSGNVGIGTASPEDLLNVLKNQNAQTVVNIDNNNTGTAASSYLRLRNNDADTGALAIGVLGTGFTTTGGFIQDSGVISASSLMSGGLNLITRASAPIRFYTGGHTNERMQITSAGNVGINTTTPQNTLNVVGDLNVTGTIYGIGGGDIDDLYINELGDTTGALTSDLNIDSNTFVISYDDNRVGIGTASPLDALHIRSATGTVYRGNLLLQDTAAQAIDVGGQLNFGGKSKDDGTYTEWANIKGAKFNSVSNDPSGYLSFGTRGITGMAEKMRIEKDGDVGIGTTSPSSILHVYENNTNEGNTGTMRLEQDGTGDSSLHFTLSESRTWQMGIDNSDSNKFKITPTQSSTWADTILTMETGGNVGIGQTSPNAVLEVKRVQNAETAVLVENTQDGTSAAAGYRIIGESGQALMAVTSNAFTSISGWNDTLYLDAGSGIDKGIILSAAGGASAQINFYTAGRGAGNLAMTIDENQDVGIGTTNPGYKLDVNGTTQVNVLRIGAPTNQGTITYGAGLGMIVKSTTGQPLSLGAGNRNSDITINETTGNVGIGTSSPTLTLDVSSTGFGEPANSGTTNVGFMRIGYNDRSWTGTELNTGIINSAGTNYAFWLQAQKPTDLSVGRPLLLNPIGGNVGIGTTTPQNLLNVDGDLNVTGTIYGGSGSSVDDLYINELGDTTGALTSDLNIDSNTFVISYDDDRVGIGTASPSALLDINGSVGSIEFDSTGVRQIFTRATTSYIDANVASGQLAFVVNGNADEDASLFLKADGTVGIGTDSPDYPLSVSSGNNEGIEILNSGSGDKAWRIKPSGNNLLITESSVADVMTFEAGGNVGINTTSPAATLHVAGSPGKILIDGGGVNSQPILQFRESSDLWNIRHVGTDNSLRFSDTPGGTDRVTFDSSGNVGIGTSSPGYNLHVNSSTGASIVAERTSATALKWGLSTESGAGRLYDFTNSESFAHFASGGSATLFYNNAAKIATSSTGATITGSAKISDNIISTDATGMDIVTDTTDGSDNKRIRIAGGGAAGTVTRGAYIDINGNEQAAAGRLTLAAGNAGEVIYMVGDVGIGTSSPSRKLVVVGGASADAVIGGLTFAPTIVIEDTSGRTGVVVTNVNDFLGAAANNSAFQYVYSGGDSDVSTKPVLMAWHNQTGTLTNYLNLDAGGNAYFGGNINFTGLIYGNGSQLTGVGGEDTDWNVSGFYLFPYNLSHKVGIGTSSPDSKLNIVSTVSDSDALIVQDDARKIKIGRDSIAVTDLSDVASDLYLSSNRDVFFAGSGAWKSSGNVGIGTTSPESIFDVSPANTGKYVKLTAAEYGIRIGSLQSGVQFISMGLKKTAADSNYVAETGDNAAVKHSVIQMNYNGDINFLSNTTHQSDDVITTLNTNIIIKNSGDVGIGTDSPDTLLHVEGGLGVDGALILEATGASSGFTTQQVQIRAVSRDTNGGQLIFSTDTTGGVLTDAMTISRDQNVGIGTTGPDTKLHLHEASSGANFLKITNTGTGEGASDGFIIGIGADETAQMWQYENLDLIFGTNNQQRMTILAGGNVGIGNTAPNVTLDVSGRVQSNTGLITERILFRENWPNGASSLSGDLGTWTCGSCTLTSASTSAPPYGGYIEWSWDDVDNNGIQSPGLDLSAHALVGSTSTVTMTDTRVFVKAYVSVVSADSTSEYLVMEVQGSDSSWHEVYRHLSNNEWFMAVADISNYINATSGGSTYIRFRETSGGTGDYAAVGTIYFYESNVPSHLGNMYLAYNGLGIDTVTPSSALEVSGDIELTNLYDNDATNFFDGTCTTSQGVVSIDSTGALSCQTLAVTDTDCAAESVLMGDGVCDTKASFGDGTGTVTSVATGNGISGGTITTTGTLTVAGGTCLTQDAGGLSVTALCISDAQIAQNTIDATELAANSVADSELIDEIYLPSGVRIGADAANNEFDDASGGTGSTAMYIGNQRITTENIDSVNDADSNIGNEYPIAGTDIDVSTRTVSLETTLDSVDIINELQFLDFAAGNDYEIRWWGGSDSYTISMGNDQSNHGTVTDYSMHFNMGTTANRGFTFGSSNTAVVASINALTGDIATSGDVLMSEDDYIGISGLERIEFNGGSGLLEILGANVDINGNDIIGVNKVTVTTVDPLYTIGDDRYATYLPAMVGGVKEEVTGTVMLNSDYVVDFDELETGSDLWIFYQTTDFGSQMEKLQVMLTPAFNGKVWYEKNPSENTLKISGTQEGEVSYRFTANRFDWSNWGTLYLEDDNQTGLVVPMK